MSKKIPPPLPSGNPEKRNKSAQINDSKITYWFIPPEIGALPIPLIQKNILGVVATFTRNGGECWATDTQFGEAFQWSRQKVNAAINGMVAAGWLRKDVTRLSNGTTPRRLWLAQLPVTLSPTVTSSTVEPMDLVTHGDYLCHLRGLPLSPTVTTLVTHGDTNSNIIKKEKVIKNTVADAPTMTTQVVSDYSPKKSHAKIDWSEVKAIVSPEQWAALEDWIAHRKEIKKPCTPRSLILSVKRHGDGLIAAIYFSIEKGYQGIFAAPNSFNSSDAWIVAVFQYFWNETRTPVEKPQVTDTQRATVNQALKKLGDSWRTGLSEATERDRPFRLKEFRDQLQETK